MPAMPTPKKKPTASSRRPGPRGEASVLLRVSAAEREELRRAAQRDDRPLGAWLRHVALEAARRK